MVKFEKVSVEEYINYFRQTTPPDYDINEEFIRQEYEKIQLPVRETVGSASYTMFTPVSVSFNRYDTSYIYIPTGLKFVTNRTDLALLVTPHKLIGMGYNGNFAESVKIVEGDEFKGDLEGHIVLRMRASESVNLRPGDPIASALIVQGILVDDDDCQTFRTKTPVAEPPMAINHEVEPTTEDVIDEVVEEATEVISTPEVEE